jgi:type I restriction enzyme M protein
MKSVGDEYVAASVFYVPPKARYGYTIANAQRSRLGRFFDDVMDVIEKDNPEYYRRKY